MPRADDAAVARHGEAGHASARRQPEIPERGLSETAPPEATVKASAAVRRATTIGRPLAFAFELPRKIAPRRATTSDSAVPPTAIVV